MPSFRSPNSVPSRVPSYRHHKPSGQAVVTLNGRDVYLGPWNSQKSRAEYDRLMAEWLAAGRSLPRAKSDWTVAEIGLRYWRFANGYYVKNGKPSGWLAHVKLILRRLRESHGHTLAIDFGPLALKSVRQKLVDEGHSRKYINKLIAILPRMFKWAASEEMLPSKVYNDLRTVEGLRKGRCEAPDHAPVLPIEGETVEATLPHLPEVVADMVRFQRLTGCRPQEACLVRPVDVDTNDEVWQYRPESHKTEHFDRERVIFVGPKAQDILRKYLLRDKEAYCFVPAESEQYRNAVRKENRQSPMTPSQAHRKPKRGRKRAPGDIYSVSSYRRAIHRAVDLLNRQRGEEAQEAGLEPPEAIARWSPNRLRHSAATEIRRQFGLEAAQVTLGHATADVSQIYAERDWTLAAEVMRKIG